MSKVAAYINEEDGLVCAKCYKPFTEMLTDEEITEVVSSFLKVQFQLNNPSPVFDYKGFAKAILRKAQEK